MKKKIEKTTKGHCEELLNLSTARSLRGAVGDKEISGDLEKDVYSSNNPEIVTSVGLQPNPLSGDAPSLILATLEDSKILAEKIISYGKKIICLSGNLGAGKTTLAGMIVRKILNDPDLNVKSPTFNIVQIYDNVHHYDLYRLKNLEEALEIGIEESFENATSIIEWPEIIFPILPKADVLFVEIELKGEVRRVRVQSLM
jgi:tRNA threonylcarbamoyl adenosine modification protein YjeE